MFLETFIRALKEAPSLTLEGLWDAPKAYLLSRYEGPILVITGGTEKTRLLEDLLYFAPERTLEFPSWETLPGDEIAPSPDLVGARFQTLYALAQGDQKIIIAPLQSALQKVIAKKRLLQETLHLEAGKICSFDDLPQKLLSLGFRRVPAVCDKGEFALRGGIVDLYPLDGFDPCRLEFFGDEIEEIRLFDPGTQKSIRKIDKLVLFPADEMARLKTEETASLFDYFEKPPLVVFDEIEVIEDRYVAFKNLPHSDSSLFSSFDTLFQSKQLYFSKHPLESLSEVHAPQKGRAYYTGKDPVQPVHFEIFERKIASSRVNHPFEPIALDALPSDYAFTIVSPNESEEKMIKERLHLKGDYRRGLLSSGLIDHDTRTVILPTSELTGRQTLLRQKRRTSHHIPAAEFHELAVGDLVVHFHNGVGKFLGIEKQKNIQGDEEEFLLIAYASDSKLYVPLSQAHLVSRYIGAREESPPLNALGTNKWLKARQKTEQSIVGYARDMLTLQAERISAGGMSCAPDSEDMALFEEEFPFTETEDQLKAIAAIKDDLIGAKAMDRLVCGDVGYGKTEVAMRAAFKAVVDGGKQVALLVPTTVLAMQHYENFKERMSNFPLKIGVVSRFCKPKEIKATLEKTAAGQIDILIGTHRLISQDVHFKDLGLLIIDEEQRFGVRAKEHLKKVKKNIDCLTLSATPIPRTLYMSLVGVRDLSTISTPPHDRLPIKTIISETEENTIKNALLRELSRDGQAYFIHNRVETIFERAHFLQGLLPSARISVVHGQMSSDEIDRVFHTFKSGKSDILVATTILENGIDIPNANTILIDRAQTFGMADLYQLRGRVGRWNRPAYAYFLVPKGRALPEESRRRLQALVESSGFGGGMKLAMRDLEIRGAGDILGTAQAGHVSSVGFHLYCKLLKRTIAALQKNEKASFLETKMEFGFPAKIPEYYLPETSLRLEIYHRLGETKEAEEVDEIYKELIDRFGKAPKEVEWLMALTRIRILAEKRHYLLLKFEKVSLYTEKQEAKGIKKERFPLPTFITPHQLETFVSERLFHV